MPNLLTWFNNWYRCDIHLWTKNSIGLSAEPGNQGFHQMKTFSLTKREERGIYLTWSRAISLFKCLVRLYMKNSKKSWSKNFVGPVKIYLMQLDKSTLILISDYGELLYKYAWSQYPMRAILTLKENAWSLN